MLNALSAPESILDKDQLEIAFKEQVRRSSQDHWLSAQWQSRIPLPLRIPSIDGKNGNPWCLPYDIMVKAANFEEALEAKQVYGLDELVSDLKLYQQQNIDVPNLRAVDFDMLYQIELVGKIIEMGEENSSEPSPDAKGFIQTFKDEHKWAEKYSWSQIAELCQSWKKTWTDLVRKEGGIPNEWRENPVHQFRDRLLSWWFDSLMTVGLSNNDKRYDQSLALLKNYGLTLEGIANNGIDDSNKQELEALQRQLNEVAEITDPESLIEFMKYNLKVKQIMLKAHDLWREGRFGISVPDRRQDNEGTLLPSDFVKEVGRLFSGDTNGNACLNYYRKLKEKFEMDPINSAEATFNLMLEMIKSLLIEKANTVINEYKEVLNKLIEDLMYNVKMDADPSIVDCIFKFEGKNENALEVA